MARTQRDWRAPLVAGMATLVAHVLLVFALVHVDTPGVPVPPAAGDALPIQFIRRPHSAADVDVDVEADRARTPRPTAMATAPGASTPAGDTGVPDAGWRADDAGDATAPLDLGIDEPRIDIRVRDGFDRPQALDPRTTRFSGAWAPDGDALAQAAFRRPTVALAVGLFGGPPERCSEVERRLRRKNCLALHGEEAEDEVLRRRMDR